MCAVGAQLTIQLVPEQGMGNASLCLLCCVSSVQVAFKYVPLAVFLYVRIWEVVCQWVGCSVIAAT